MNTAIELRPLEICRVLDTPVADTWQAWTDPDIVSLWFAPGAMRCEVLEYDVRAGGSYRIRMRDESDGVHTVAGRFVEVTQERRIVMSWGWEGSDAPVSQVTVSFAAHGDGTRVDILHEGLVTEESIAAHREGWEGCLDKLPATPSQGEPS